MGPLSMGPQATKNRPKPTRLLWTRCTSKGRSKLTKPGLEFRFKNQDQKDVIQPKKFLRKMSLPPQYMSSQLPVKIPGNSFYLKLSDVSSGAQKTVIFKNFEANSPPPLKRLAEMKGMDPPELQREKQGQKSLRGVAFFCQDFPLVPPPAALGDKNVV